MTITIFLDVDRKGILFLIQGKKWCKAKKIKSRAQWLEKACPGNTYIQQASQFVQRFPCPLYKWVFWEFWIYADWGAEFWSLKRKGKRKAAPCRSVQISFLQLPNGELQVGIRQLGTLSFLIKSRGVQFCPGYCTLSQTFSSPTGSGSQPWY